MKNVKTLKDALANGKVSVTFEKRNGDERVMLCTTNQNMFEYEFKGTTRSTSQSSTIVTVWDLEQDAWRSFDTESVIEWSPVS